MAKPKPERPDPIPPNRLKGHGSPTGTSGKTGKRDESKEPYQTKKGRG